MDVPAHQLNAPIAVRRHPAKYTPAACAKTVFLGCAAARRSSGEAAVSLRDRVRGLLEALQPAYWQALLVVSLLYFARFDASFITLRAKTVRSLCRACLAPASLVW